MSPIQALQQYATNVSNLEPINALLMNPHTAILGLAAAAFLIAVPIACVAAFPVVVTVVAVSVRDMLRGA